tara:strand:+ start:2387 stop:2719 length:333 start_codon:yes stop_codon:yes gene_type:complete
MPNNPQYLHSEDRIILSQLIDRKEINIYEIHKEYLLSPGQISRVVSRLIELNVATYENLSLKLTEDKFLNAVKLLKDVDRRPLWWRSVSPENRFKGKKETLYTPQKNNLG